MRIGLVYNVCVFTIVSVKAVLFLFFSNDIDWHGTHVQIICMLYIMYIYVYIVLMHLLTRVSVGPESNCP